MTVATLLSTMTMREFGDWVAWFRMRHEEHEKTQRERSGVQPTGAGGFHLDLTTDSGVAQLSTAFKGKS
jgi:hypothetical protein